MDSISSRFMLLETRIMTLEAKMFKLIAALEFIAMLNMNANHLQKSSNDQSSSQQFTI
mgnify:FL=1